MTMLAAAELDKARRLRDDLRIYARTNLKIVDKSGNLVPLVFNRAQDFIHEKLEEQKRQIGKVRALILKGRQEGSSTYICGRFYHILAFHAGLTAATLTHLASATDKLFGKNETFQKNNPLPPPLRRMANKRNIEFDDIDCFWDFGTAGTDNVGRGGTVQLFHASEAPFWKHPEQIVKGMLQSVSDLPGTEVIFESTANGMDPVFYKKCMEALAGEGEYMLIFVPWFWMDEYQKPVSVDFQLTDKEVELKELYGLTDAQINWRRFKIIELGGEYAFNESYPCNPQEAFQTSGDSFIPTEHVLRARKRKLDKFIYQASPLICGLDPSRIRDRAVFTFRKGPKILKSLVFDPKKGEIREGLKVVGTCPNELKQSYLAEKCKFYLDQCGVDLLNIDTTEGMGQGIVERLRDDGYENDKVRGVMFSQSADDPERYANKRAEIWDRQARWLSCEDGPVQVPDDDAFQADLCSMPKPENTANSRMKMPDKDLIRKKRGISPDIGDSSALTFAFLIKATHPEKVRIKKANPEKSGLRTLAKKRGQSSQPFSSQNIFQR